MFKIELGLKKQHILIYNQKVEKKLIFEIIE